MNGGKLSMKSLNTLFNAGYGDKPANMEGYVLDSSISKARNKVYNNPETGQTVVVHRGTKGAKDWLNNLAYAVGGEKMYKKTHRYKDAKKVQSEAEKKYGTSELSTIGHSQGGLQAEMLGKKGKETITYNKASRPFTNNKIASNQYDVRNKGDIISRMNPFQRYNKNEYNFNSKSSNPLEAHSTEALLKAPTDLMIGKNIVNINHKRI